MIDGGETRKDQASTIVDITLSPPKVIREGIVPFGELKNIIPDLTFVFDIEAKKGLSRIRRAKDRIEQREIAYHKRVRQGYLQIAEKESSRVKVIGVNKSREEIHEIVKKHVDRLLIDFF